MAEEPEVHALIDSLRAHGQDFTEVEVKRASGGYPELGETLSAFGNMPQGGTIILGLDEELGFSATGISDPAAFIERLSAQARTGITPPLQVGFNEVVFEGVTLLVAHVAPLPLHQRPARYRGIAYLRQGDGDYRMSNEEVQQMYSLRDRPRNDAAPIVGSSVSDLDTELTEKFLERVRSSSRRLADQDDTTVLKRKGVLASDGETLTVAGLYALGDYPQQFLPGLSITAAVQHRVGVCVINYYQAS